MAARLPPRTPSAILMAVVLALGAAGAAPAYAQVASAQPSPLQPAFPPPAPVPVRLPSAQPPSAQEVDEAVFSSTVVLADAGDAYAALKVARSYRYGTGVAPDIGAAIEWLKEAADAGAPEALNDLGDLALDGIRENDGPISPDPEAALAFYLRGAQAGLTGRLERIGDLYARPDLSIRDRARADEYWRRAAESYDAEIEAGEVWPCVRLARMYAEGRGVPLSAARAIELYELAVTRGNLEATIAIGDIFFDGEIVPKDPVRALEHYRRSEADGFGIRLERMGNMYRDGMGVIADAGTAAAYWHRAIDDYRARAGTDGWAALALGRMLRDGKGVAADPEAALALFQRADALGAPGARREISDTKALIASGPT